MIRENEEAMEHRIRSFGLAEGGIRRKGEKRKIFTGKNLDRTTMRMVRLM